MFLAFSRNKPIILETFCVLFAKVIDMARLYILIISDIKKIFPDLFEIPLHISGKRQRAYKIRGSQGKKRLYTTKISGQVKTLWRAMLAGGHPLPLKKKLLAKNACMFFLHWCFYLHWSRDSASPICGIFFIFIFFFYLRLNSYLIVIFQLAK